MRWLVTFTGPVVYQADHPKARRTITTLEVSAETARSAEIHALRTVQGAADIASVKPVGKLMAPPFVEDLPPDVCVEY